MSVESAAVLGQVQTHGAACAVRDLGWRLSLNVTCVGARLVGASRICASCLSRSTCRLHWRACRAGPGTHSSPNSSRVGPPRSSRRSAKTMCCPCMLALSKSGMCLGSFGGWQDYRTAAIRNGTCLKRNRTDGLPRFRRALPDNEGDWRAGAAEARGCRTRWTFV